MQFLINIDVDDLNRAVSFYRDALGLLTGRRLFDGSVVEMLGGSSKIYLLQKSAGESASAHAHLPRNYSRHWTPVHLDFEVDDVDRAVERAIAAGATLESASQSFRWGRLATLSDPFGHGFCLLQFSESGYDAEVSS
ncbi:MAG: VOC family protein [Betaproteobacteria bacterium]